MILNRDTVDTERLKAGVDLRDLAGRLVVLRKETAAEMSGPCPKCGGQDRFHVKADMAFCRQCWPLEKTPPAHDAIGFVQWAGLARGFRGAVDYLDGGRAWPSPTGPRRTAAAQAEDKYKWRLAWWQEAARRELRAAQDRLASPAGDPGAEYLLSRGILPETWQAWGLGYTEEEAWDRPLAEHLLKQGLDPKTWPALGYGVAKWKETLYVKRPAIVIPWQGNNITALKYRFLTVPEGGLRYTSKHGGEMLVFGWNMAGAHGSTLWLVEGELNALSLWQALRAEHMVNFDVASFGGETGATHVNDEVKKLVGKYQQVIVWADDPDKALAAMRALPGTYGLFGLRSPLLVPGDKDSKLDANAMLREPGALAEFARAAWNGFDRELEYTGRVEEAVKAIPDRGAA